MLKQTSSTRVHSRHENLNFDLLASSHEPHVTPTQTQESPLNHTHSLSGQWSLSRSSKMPASVSEDLKTTSSIREEISLQNGAEPSHDRPGTVTTEVPSAYAVDTFESLDSTLTHTPHHHHPITTSTPEPRGQEYSEVDDLSLMDSVQVTGSVSGELIDHECIDTCFLLFWRELSIFIPTLYIKSTLLATLVSWKGGWPI